MIKTLSFTKDILDRETPCSTKALNIMGLFIACLFAGAACENCYWAESYGAKDIVRKATNKMLTELGLPASDTAELKPLFRLFGLDLGSRSRQMTQIASRVASDVRVSEYEATKMYEILNTEMIIPVDSIDRYYDISTREYSFDDSCCGVLERFLDSHELVDFIDYYKENPILSYFDNSYIRENLHRHLKLSATDMMTLKEIFTGSRF